MSLISDPDGTDTCTFLFRNIPSKIPQKNRQQPEEGQPTQNVKAGVGNIHGKAVAECETKFPISLQSHPYL
ncbi:MAG TPA: hypothetical protein DCZ40_03025 [Lachnospiraceae bacterium]|nr:hypothetical protein [Lachnospiraceae bacterium]